MINYLIIAIILCIIGGAAYHLYRAKKRGVTCVGCPHAKQCGGKCGGGCGGTDKNN